MFGVIYERHEIVRWLMEECGGKVDINLPEKVKTTYVL